MPVTRHRRSRAVLSSEGFTLVEMIVVVFLLALAMLGILSVFDASARINKSESDIADAQGAVRYGIYSMTRAVRMAGAGGLYVTQAVVNTNPGLPGLSVTNTIPGSYDNVRSGTSVASTDTVTPNKPVRPGTDMIEIRGVINSPLLGYDLEHGCEPCNASETPSGGCSPCKDTTKLNAAVQTNTAHVNDNASQRPQFSQIDAYTAGASVGLPMFVMVAFNDDLRSKCAIAEIYPLYPQSPYNVGKITGPTQLIGSQTFGDVIFDDPNSTKINAEKPGDPGRQPYQLEKNVRHAGILDDLIFFIDNSNPLHPALAQGTRRGDVFDVVTLADDVEDMQIAYGVDTNAVGTPGYNAINRLVAATPSDADSNVSSQPAGDEWVPNVAGADNPITNDATPYVPAQFVDQPNLCPRLHSVMIALVAKSHDPDPTYRAPSARGYLAMNSPVTIASPYPDTAHYTGIPVTTYRRRVQTLKINLRNYAYEGN
jgi:type II secretory pathway pseudopilin PulG